ncbi:MAG: tetratricopeptide repeat protein [Fuerstiella sp.]|nr:tetratricopeptide repeat protein [Fuerstiella sp.]
MSAANRLPGGLRVIPRNLILPSFGSRMSTQPVFRPRAITALLLAALVIQPDASLADKATDDFKFGVGLWRKQRWTSAAQVFSEFLKEYPDHQRAQLATFYLGLTWSSLKKYGLSREQFQRYLDLNPDSPNTAAAKYRLGECSYYLGEYETAVTQFETYTREHPGHKLIDWGHLQLGDSLIQVGRFQEAEVVITRLVTTTSSDNIKVQAQYSLGLSLEKREEPDAALEAYRSVALSNDIYQAPRALARSGTIRFQQERYESAAAFYDQIVSRFPDSRLTPLAALNSGLAMYRIQKFEDAVRRFRQVSIDSNKHNESVLLTGMSFSRLNRLDEARSALKAVFKSGGDPDHAAEALFELGRLEQLAGEHKLAVQIYTQLAERWPADTHTPDALFNAANLQLGLEETTSADRLLKRLTQKYPAHAAKPRTMFLAGRIQLKQKQSAAARESLRQVVLATDTEPRTMALSLYYLARIDHEQNLFESALSAVQQLQSFLDDDTNRDLRGALALGAMSALELRKFETAEELATDYLKHGVNGTQTTDALAARTIARASVGNYSGAILDSDQLIQTASDSLQTWTSILQAAENAWDQKDYESALELFRRSNSIHAPEVTRQSGASGTAWCLFHRNQFKEAAGKFNEAASTRPESSIGIEARYMAVRCLHEDGQTEAAIEQYTILSKDFSVLASEAATTELRQRLQSYALDAGRTAARLLDSAKRRDEANTQWSELADRFSDSGELDAILDEWALANLQAKQYSQSDLIYRRLLKTRPGGPFEGTARLSLAESDLDAGRTEEAMHEFQEIMDHRNYEDSEKATAMFHLIQIRLEQESWEQVTKLAGRFARVHSNSQLVHRIQSLHANALMELNQPNQAREILETLRKDVLEGYLEPEPWTERIWIVLGEVELASKRYAQVDTIAQEFEKQFPESPIGFQMSSLQGRRWKNKPEPDFGKAREFFTRIIDDESARGTRLAAKSQCLIADMCLMQKNYAQAREAYFRVYILYPYPDLQSQALFQVGNCQLQLGKTKDAAKTWESLLNEFPESPYAKDAAKLLKSTNVDTVQP